MAPTPLQIKVNSLKRLIKEETLYKQEVTDQEKYVEQMKSKDADEYELKKQVQVLEESQRMVPELTRKIKEHKEALVSFLDTYTGDEDVSVAKSLIQ
ncbi:tubulin-specific chaperone A [[Candida] anglica]|uniref:Tubulin-specific chaperone A n=1 Tax=[Candida] anglica TaxID=148631 RepID=A0ABP0EEY4_9ASCO